MMFRELNVLFVQNRKCNHRKKAENSAIAQYALLFNVLIKK